MLTSAWNHIELSESWSQPLTINDWVLLQARGGGAKRILSLIDSLETPDTAWISIATPELIRAQWQALEAFEALGELLPLYGVPFAVKDNIDVVGFSTTAACPDFAYEASEDAQVVAVLKRAGAIVIGKTNLDQFATGLVGTRSPYGVVPNIFDPEYISGGSSSGSASVVGRAICPFALGTDTAGSGRVPAGLNNIVGLKPTRGALSTRGVIPACRSLDCVSVLALNTEDAELILQIATVYDEKDSFARAAPESPTSGAIPEKPCIAICQDPQWFGQEEHKVAYLEALKLCKEIGWNLIPTDFSLLFKLADLLYEGPWVSERFAAIKDFISRPDVSMDPVVHSIIAKARNFSSVDVFEAEYLRRDLTRDIEIQFNKFSAILTPTTPKLPTIQDLNKSPVLENSRLGTYTNFVNLLDWSALTFPAGFRSDGLPFSLTLISTQWQEQKLLALSRQILAKAPRRIGISHVVRQERTVADLGQARTVLAVVGAHISGLPLNHQLLDMDANLISTTQTAPRYRLYELNYMPSPKLIRKPGLRRVLDGGTGFSIEVELWNIPTKAMAKFARSISLPLSLGRLELFDGSWVTGFICDNVRPDTVKADISQYGGWKKYLESASLQETSLPTSQHSALKKILIANRGEIAIRIASTLKKLDIHSIAVYSKEDRGSQHVKMADSSFLLEGTTVAETYLSRSQIIQIAKGAGADGIIPGYGFLSESADFAETCEEEGLVWIGPTPKQMRALGLKHLARELAEKSQVPLLPGSSILENVDVALREAERVGYPLMVKSTAGGGGIGLQKCSSQAELRKSFATVQHQGKTYFNNDGVFLEHFIRKARHIEVQIIGNGEGDVRHVGVRDCSLQRRNQKVIEESPAIFIPCETSRKMCEAAVSLTKFLSYRSVGTVEFIYDSDTGRFYFLEVNTRLQVEHPITEAISGIDLVEAMIHVASHNSAAIFDDLSNDEDNHLVGHAIEARIYAENPLKSFLPSTGHISELSFPESARVDTWITIGTKISSSFDPLLAKIIVHGTNRKDAMMRLHDALEQTRIFGIETNLEYLRCLTEFMPFINGDFCTTTLNTFELKPVAIQVMDPGPLTAIQDYPGRVGFWHVGIPSSGPMDDYSFRLANKILGNGPDATGLECTSSGPSLLFHDFATIAVTGAPAQVKVDEIEISMFVPIRILPGQILSIGKATAGYRTYLGVSMGIKTAKVFGSSSTFELGRLGGHKGRRLVKDDILYLSKSNPSQAVLTPVRRVTQPSYGSHWRLRVMPGPHAFPDFLARSDYEALFKVPWKVHYNSNRTGIRLIGPKPIWARDDGGEAGLHSSNIHDSPYSIGSISFTGDEAVILTGDSPSLGGFLVFATVISAEMWKVGQMKPGDEIMLCPITVAEAMLLNRDLTEAIDTLSSLPDRTLEPSVIDPILDSIGSHDRRIICRQAGDTAILLEFGPTTTYTLRTSFHIHAFMNLCASFSAESSRILELTPGVRSIHVRYYPGTPQAQILTHLAVVESSLPKQLATTVTSRTVSLPIVFDHPSVLAAVSRYARTIRPTAPWLPNNIDFLTSVNGLSSRNELQSIILSSEYLVLGLGDVFFGAPCAVPLDPRQRLYGTKYSPNRSFTPDGTVGIGGMFLCIYSIDSPGGYQLVGRTVPIWNRWVGEERKMWMFEIFDRITFYEIEQDVLDAARDAGSTELEKLIKFEEGTLDLEQYEKWIKNNQGEIDKVLRMRDQGLRDTGIMEFLREPYRGLSSKAESKFEVNTNDNDIGVEQGMVVKAEVAGRCWKCDIKEGSIVQVGTELVRIVTITQRFPYFIFFSVI